MPKEATLTSTPADELKYQNELVRTGNYLPLGRMRMISIEPNKDCPPLPTWDPVMKKWGRLIQFRDQVLPIAQSRDRSMILITAPLLNAQGRVALPDVPQPDWTPPPPTKEEIEGREVKDPSTGKTHREPVQRKNVDAPMIPQSLSDRADGFVNGTYIYHFAPVTRIMFQPEFNNAMLGTFWKIICTPRFDGTHVTFLVDKKTGEAHFFGGSYEIVRAAGE